MSDFLPVASKQARSHTTYIAAANNSYHKAAESTFIHLKGKWTHTSMKKEHL